VDVSAILAGIILELPFIVGLLTLLGKKTLPAKSPGDIGKAVSIIALAAVAVLFLLDLIKGVPPAYALAFLLLSLVPALASARRPFIVLLMVLGFLCGHFGFFMAARWDWSYEDGFRVINNTAVEAAFLDITAEIGGQDLRVVRSQLFPAFEATLTKPPYAIRVEVKARDGAAGTPFRVSNIKMTADGKPIEGRFVLQEGPAAAEARGVLRQEPPSWERAPWAWQIITISTGSASFQPKDSFEVEFDLAIDLPSGARTWPVKLDALRSVNRDLRIDPFDL